MLNYVYIPIEQEIEEMFFSLSFSPLRDYSILASDFYKERINPYTLIEKMEQGRDNYGGKWYEKI